MKSTWRWFGPQDSVSLQNVIQAGATGVVTSLHHIPTGDVWPVEEIARRKAEIERAGLEWSVIESIPLHNDLKKMSGRWREYLENYKQSIRNVGALVSTRCATTLCPLWIGRGPILCTSWTTSPMHCALISLICRLRRVYFKEKPGQIKLFR